MVISLPFSSSHPLPSTQATSGSCISSNKAGFGMDALPAPGPLRLIVPPLSARLDPMSQLPDSLLMPRLPDAVTPIVLSLYMDMLVLLARSRDSTELILTVLLLILILSPAYMLMFLSACKFISPCERTFTLLVLNRSMVPSAPSSTQVCPLACSI